MSVCQQAVNRRRLAVVNRPKGLRGQALNRGRKERLSEFTGKVSKTARKSAGK